MEHEAKKVKCAMKKISKPSARDIEMGSTWNANWKKDVEKLAQLKSPFVVRTYDAFEDEDYAYIVMEYCSTGDLKYLMFQRTKAGKCFTESVFFFSSLLFLFRSFLLLSTQEVNRYVAELVSGLVEIHAANIIHRDIKPGNTMVSASGQLKIGVILSFIHLNLVVLFGG
jgi:serine/threonine protein kinase